MTKLHAGNTPLWMSTLLLLILGYSSMFNNISLPNERSRAYLAVAIVDHKTFSIDEPLKTFGRIGDRARFQGQYFSDKAPGTGLMGSLIYGLAKLIHGDENWTMAELLRLFRRGLVLPFALMGFIWFRRILASYRLSSFTVEWVSFSWLLGSAAFHYSGAFFGHQISASLLLGCFLNLKRSNPTSSARTILTSGLLAERQ